MPSDSLANNWSSFDGDEICWWDATFPFTLGPDILRLWQDLVIEAGENSEVYRIERIDRIDYLRDRDGPISNFLQRTAGTIYANNPWLPKSFLLGRLDQIASSRLVYADSTGNARDAWVSDMHQFAYPLGLERSYPYPPLAVHTTVFDEEDPTESETVTSFALSTDIWFPWGSAFSHESGWIDEVLDNRGLAAHNAPRLNQFLRQAYDATLRLGGTWTANGGFAHIRAQLDETGVNLAAPRPS
ncbi:hypothetical protein ACFOX0_25770 [Micromonospora zhanjiangensis]|uniref:Uncharacterized protein n=1 Tax=Micromonospora zhanjiangensis TaxID=1522057 RepID=A0ABV8KT80_9ACTN